MLICSCGYEPTNEAELISHLAECSHLSPARRRLPLRPYFELGTVVATPGALDVITDELLFAVLFRHATGDWGDLGLYDKALNDHALTFADDRLFSRYNLGDGDVIYIITESNRELTTILLAGEY